MSSRPSSPASSSPSTRPEPQAELGGLVGGVRALGHHAVDDPGPPQVGRPHALGLRHLPGVVDVAVHDRRRALRRQRAQPAVGRGQHPVGRHQRQRAAAGALAEQHRQRRRLEHHQVVQAAGDLPGQPALLGLPGQRGAGGVDEGDQRQPQLLGQVHAAPRLAQRRRAERRRHALAPPVLARAPRTGAPPKRASASSSPGSFSPAPVPDSPTTSVAAVRSSRRTPGRSSRRDAVTTSQAVRSSSGSSASVPSSGVGPLGAADVGVPRLARGQHPQRPVGDVADLLVRDDGVDQAALGEVLGGLHALGERLAVERLVDPRAEEADRGTRLGDRHVARAIPRTRAPRRRSGCAGRRGRGARPPCAGRSPR